MKKIQARSTTRSAMRKRSIRESRKASKSNPRYGNNKLTFLSLEPRQLLAADLVLLSHITITGAEAQSSIVAIGSQSNSVQTNDAVVYRLAEELQRCKTNTDASIDEQSESDDAGVPCLNPITFDLNLAKVDRLFTGSGSASFIDSLFSNSITYRVDDLNQGRPVITASSGNDRTVEVQGTPIQTITLAPISMIAGSGPAEAMPVVPMNLTPDDTRDTYFAKSDNTFQNPLAATIANDSSSAMRNSSTALVRSGLINEYQTFSIIGSSQSLASSNSLAIGSKGLRAGSFSMNHVATGRMVDLGEIGSIHTDRTSTLDSLNKTTAIATAFFDLDSNSDRTFNFNSPSRSATFASLTAMSQPFQFSAKPDSGVTLHLSPVPVLRMQLSPTVDSRESSNNTPAERTPNKNSVSVVDSSLPLLVIVSNLGSIGKETDDRKSTTRTWRR